MSQTLYQKIGGEKAVESLVDRFYENVFADEQLSPFFEQVNKEQLKRMQSAFFSIALDGPELPTKFELANIHRGLGITTRHLTLFTDQLLKTLVEIGVGDREANEICARIAMYSNEVLGESSTDG